MIEISSAGKSVACNGGKPILIHSNLKAKANVTNSSKVNAI